MVARARVSAGDCLCNRAADFDETLSIAEPAVVVAVGELARQPEPSRVDPRKIPCHVMSVRSC